jgi:anti-sigma B factor antagonist
MGDAQYVRLEPAGPVALAVILREKITEHENQPVFGELVKAASGSRYRLAIDLGGVGFLSSAGLGALIALHKTCAAAGGKLVVFGIQDQILSLLKLTQLHRLLTIVDGRDEALQKAGA